MAQNRPKRGRTPVGKGKPLPTNKAAKTRASAKRKRKGKPLRPAAAAIAVALSDNNKTGPVACTYAAQGSCPVTCPLIGAGCYAEEGPVGIITRRLNAAGVGMTPDEIAEVEAAAIDRLPSLTDMRLHVVGDCRTNTAAATVAAAATRYADRFVHKAHGAPQGVWTYTHAWRTVDRASWGAVSVLASCETPFDVDQALARGYAAALVVPEFPNGDRAWRVDTLGGSFAVVPCPYQTKGVQCVKCRLCMADDRLRSGRVAVGFAAHGARANTVKRALEVLNGE